MTKRNITINVYGRVQGVGFRYQTYHWAKKNKLTGYVRNMNDGSVKIVACGNDQQINMLTCWLEQGGPPGAKIDHFQSHFGDAEEMTDFSIRH
ncbi:acylphosphatase [Xenorhabdus szentirmaii]|uniref:Acylphosphatase n=1 Tax=Xenorhabdus szentirmaii DSM 16338 TaxID=1427518 RepID=W1IZN1_9GAMM|nr:MULTISPECIES: acylphosphatase [Xenorhabdus]MBD2782103.1 acylphosphatase [Xenorhabdus sp. 38]MBD2791486.1 acylphosphatase [Xenorhabdus sp. CUL]MBD2803904.1 acylphosphatase [Xenorhabdus sp. ZM]MBD2819520.1 acylphosphatase [Xenorhabdus sp. 42]MBD2825396.1 acylphosphatase [Xenorhabdus sp. 5]